MMFVWGMPWVLRWARVSFALTMRSASTTCSFCASSSAVNSGSRITDRGCLLVRNDRATILWRSGLFGFGGLLTVAARLSLPGFFGAGVLDCAGCELPACSGRVTEGRLV